MIWAVAAFCIAFPTALYLFVRRGARRRRKASRVALEGLLAALKDDGRDAHGGHEPEGY